MELNEVRRLANLKLASFRDRLLPAIGNSFDLFYGGSIQTGLYSGPKSSRLSGNSECPFSSIVEVDLRIVLHNKSPHDKEVIMLLVSLLNLPGLLKSTYVHWDRISVPVSLATWYDTLDPDLGLEWELSVYSKPHVDISLYWEKLFTSEEMYWQRTLRRWVAEAPLDKKMHNDFKTPHHFEARWRLVACCALWKLKSSGISSSSSIPCLPVLDRPENPVQCLVDKWLQGCHGYRTMERPTELVSNEVRNVVVRHHKGMLPSDLFETPTEPAWVTYAEKLQKQLKSK